MPTGRVKNCIRFQVYHHRCGDDIHLPESALPAGVTSFVRTRVEFSIADSVAGRDLGGTDKSLVSGSLHELKAGHGRHR